MVERAKSYESDTVPGDYATMATPCPKCGGTVQENYRRYACLQCDFSLPKHPGSRSFEYPEVEQLLKERSIGPLTGFRSKMGRPFAAALKISPEFKLEFDFGNGTGEDDGTEVDFSGLTPLGPCPKCGSPVYEQAMAYVCEKSVGSARSCDFRSGRVILQQTIEAEQMRKLLANGRTDLLRGFVSNRTRRKFAAFLIRKPDGSTGFEFEPRPARGAAGDAGAAPAPGEAPAAKAAKAPARTSAKAASKVAVKAAPAAKATTPKGRAPSAAAAPEDEAPWAEDAASARTAKAAKAGKAAPAAKAAKGAKGGAATTPAKSTPAAALRPTSAGQRSAKPAASAAPAAAKRAKAAKTVGKTVAATSRAKRAA